MPIASGLAPDRGVADPFYAYDLTYPDKKSPESAAPAGGPDRSSPILVRNLGELHAALNSAKGGEVIELAAGDYGDFYFSRKKFASDVTIKSADAENPAVFNTLTFYDVRNVAVDGVDVQFKPTEDTVDWDGVVTISNAHNVTFKNSTMQGAIAETGVPGDSNPGENDGSGNVIGKPIARAFKVTFASEIHIEGNDVRTFSTGVGASQVEGLSVIDNTILDLRRSPFTGSDLDDLVIRGNHFGHSNPHNLGGAGDHADFVHLWNRAGDSEPDRNIEIVGNFFDQGPGQAIFGIFLEAEWHTKGYENVTIAENVLLNTDANGIVIQKLNGGAITNNTLLSAGDDPKKTPGVLLRDQTQNVVIDKNVLGYVDYKSKVPQKFQKTIDVGDNLLAQRHAPENANYYEDLFVNALAVGADLDDLQALPKGLIASGDYGAAVTRFDATPSTLTPIARPDQDDRNDFAFTFDASFTADADGFVSSDEATFIWDFGDGASAKGVSVSHVYDTPGDHKVKLRVEHEDGTSAESHTTASIADPTYLKVNFEEGFKDASTYGAWFLQNKSLQNGLRSDDGHYYSLYGASKFAIGGVPQMQHVDQFSITFVLKRGSVYQGGGILMRIHPGLDITIKDNGEAKIWVIDGTGNRVKFTTKDADIDDLDWHALTFVYDSFEGRMAAYVDGAFVGGAAVEGTPNFFSGSQKVFLGSPFSGYTFWGGLKSIDIEAKAHDAASTAALHAALLDGAGSGQTKNHDDVFVGGREDDYFDGGPGQDDISGGRGDDDLDGGSGNDKVNGGSGDDVIRAGSGDDTVYGGRGADVIEGEAGRDKLVAGRGDDELDGGADDDVILGGGGDDTVYGGDGRDEIVAGGGRDRVDGGAGDDAIYGANGDDELFGGDGRDRIVGGRGADEIYGGDGADNITGGRGDDLLSGGPGADVFVFNSRDGFDEIVDFDPTEGDRLQLNGLNAANVRLIQADDGVRVVMSRDTEALLRGVDIDEVGYSILKRNPFSAASTEPTGDDAAEAAGVLIHDDDIWNGLL